MTLLAIFGNVILALVLGISSYLLFRHNHAFLSPRLAILFAVTMGLMSIEHMLDAQAFYFGPNPYGAGFRIAIVPMAAWLVFDMRKTIRERVDG